MKFTELSLSGVWRVELETFSDDRGWFARIFCKDEFAARGLPHDFCQQSLSYSRLSGTLRGLHVQKPPHQEAKLIRCIRGSVFDVAVDLRPCSPTFGHWCATPLSARNQAAIFIPKGCAHGFQTLEPDTELLYAMDQVYVPDHAVGIRWNDPTLRITWPLDHPILSPRDEALPYFLDISH